MADVQEQRLPAESDAYRQARNRLLTAEKELRKQVESVAALRRGLPPGGKVKEEYVFEEGGGDLADREIEVENPDVGIVRSRQEQPGGLRLHVCAGGDPCPMCSAFLDSLNGNAVHIAQRVNLAVVAKAPIGTIRDWARARGWNNLRLLSSGGNSFNADYLAEAPNGSQWPIVNVFPQGR